MHQVSRASTPPTRVKGQKQVLVKTIRPRGHDKSHCEGGETFKGKVKGKADVEGKVKGESTEWAGPSPLAGHARGK